MLDVGGMATFDEMKILSVNPHSYWALIVAGIRIILDLPNVSAGTGSSDGNQPKTIQLFALQYLRWCYDPNSSTSQSSQPYPQPCFQ